MTGLSLPPLNVSSLLKQYGVRPSKGLGQNFLQDNHILQRIVAAAELSMEDSVLEIGPGLGNLTRYLALSSRSVTAVELDAKLLPALESVLAPYSNVRLVQGDILALDPASLMEQPGYQVVANIPYYITSALTRHLLGATIRPSRIVLTVQREVAERICAQAGELSLLALSVQVFGQPEILFTIPPSAFHPPPTVDSAVVRIRVHPRPVIPEQDLEQFFRLIRAGFSQKRKTLRNSLSGGLRLPPVEVEHWLASSGIDPQRRAETLDLEEWAHLCSSMQMPEV